MAAFLLFLIFNSHTTDVVELRKLYYQANDSKKLADEFFSVMKDMKNTADPLILGYKGMAHLMQAKYSYNPYSKLSNFSKGKDLLNDAISKAPGNIELRFMRFCAQTNAPKFLGYNSQIKEDKALVLAKWKKCKDIDLKGKIKEYILRSGYCNNYEKSSFE